MQYCVFSFFSVFSSSRAEETLKRAGIPWLFSITMFFTSYCFYCFVLYFCLRIHYRTTNTTQRSRKQRNFNHAKRRERRESDAECKNVFVYELLFCFVVYFINSSGNQGSGSSPSQVDHLVVFVWRTSYIGHIGLVLHRVDSR